MLPAIEKETSAVSRAIKWLDTVTDPDGGIHRWLNLETGELGPVSTEITGYAAHLFAWLARETGEECYKQRAMLHGDWIMSLFAGRHYLFLPFEPGSNLQYFFDCGIAARALVMMTYVADRFSGTAEIVSTSMLSNWNGDIYCPVVERTALSAERIIPKPGWWSSEPGAYQMKAALALTRAHRSHLMESLSWQEWNGDGNLLHPMAYFVEAAYLSGNKLVAAMGLEILHDGIHQVFSQGALVRTDVLAQSLRLNVLMRNDYYRCVDELNQSQHESGGFHFASTNGHLSPDLSTHATIFAIQALMMAEGHTTDYKELTIV